MAEAIDETAIIAWIDGELDPARAVAVERALRDDPALASLADRHRRMKARFAAAFRPLAADPPRSAPTATIVSLAAVRNQRREQAAHARVSRRWMVPGAIAASLAAGLLVGHGLQPASGIGDRANTLALAPSIGAALDHQLSGDGGPVRIALSFRDHGGHLCRSFDARRLAGIACREEGSWLLRYGAPVGLPGGDYRQAGSNQQRMAAVDSLIAGDPLDRGQEEAARADGWR